MDGMQARNVSTRPSRHRFTLDDALAMVAAGILPERHGIELIDGELIDMAPMGSGHAGTVAGLNHVLVAACGINGLVWV